MDGQETSTDRDGQDACHGGGGEEQQGARQVAPRSMSTIRGVVGVPHLASSASQQPAMNGYPYRDEGKSAAIGDQIVLWKGFTTLVLLTTTTTSNSGRQERCT